MSAPFIGEIRMVGFNFPPRGWAICSGQTLPIAQNTALFSLLGVTYGGNGTTIFQLPNLQGRVAVNQGSGPGLTPRVLGETGGAQSVTLLATQMPTHNHTIPASSSGANSTTPSTFASAGRGAAGFYAAGGNAVPMAPTQIASGGQPHENMQPYLTVLYVIALQGIFPARN